MGMLEFMKVYLKDNKSFDFGGFFLNIKGSNQRLKLESFGLPMVKIEDLCTTVTITWAKFVSSAFI